MVLTILSALVRFNFKSFSTILADSRFEYFHNIIGLEGSDG